MANILGDNLLVYIDGVTPAAGDLVLCSTSCTLNLEQATVESSCKDGEGTKWSTAIPGTASWSISTDGLYNPVLAAPSFDELASKIITDADGGAANSVSIVFEVSGQVNPDIEYYTGTAILTSCSLNGPTGEFATYSAEFKGVGALTQSVKAA